MTAKAHHLTAAVLLSAALSLPSQTAFARFAGQVYDTATGYRCIDPACTALVLPQSDCLCLKIPPNETDARKVKLKCNVPGDAQRSCPVPDRYR